MTNKPLRPSDLAVSSSATQSFLLALIVKIAHLSTVLPDIVLVLAQWNRLSHFS